MALGFPRHGPWRYHGVRARSVGHAQAAPQVVRSVTPSSTSSSGFATPSASSWSSRSSSDVVAPRPARARGHALVSVAARQLAFRRRPSARSGARPLPLARARNWRMRCVAARGLAVIHLDDGLRRRLFAARPRHGSRTGSWGRHGGIIRACGLGFRIAPTPFHEPWPSAMAQASAPCLILAGTRGSQFLLHHDPSPRSCAAQRTSLVPRSRSRWILGVALSAAWPAAMPAVAFLGHLFIPALKAPPRCWCSCWWWPPSSATTARARTRTCARILLLYRHWHAAAAAVAWAASMVSEHPSSRVQHRRRLRRARLGGAAQRGGQRRGPTRSAALQDAKPLSASWLKPWSLGVALRHASESTREMCCRTARRLHSGSSKWVICRAPLGILGLVVATTLAEARAGTVGACAAATVLLGCMPFMALVVNPLIVFLTIRRNPYPLVLTCSARERRDGLLHAAARPPTSPSTCTGQAPEPERRDLQHRHIPLGATINTAGAPPSPSACCRWRPPTPWDDP